MEAIKESLKQPRLESRFGLRYLFGLGTMFNSDLAKALAVTHSELIAARNVGIRQFSAFRARFEFKQVPRIVKGAADWRVALCASFVFIVLPKATLADVVTDWNERAFATMAAMRVGETGQARTLAMMHTALYEGVRAATKAGVSVVSQQAAAHAAAHRILAGLYPAQSAELDSAFDATLKSLPEGAPRSTGVAAGEKAAVAMLGLRKADGYDSVVPDNYRPVTSPGVYITTELPVASQLSIIKPLALTSVSQFRPGPPPKLDSATWARDYNETMLLGGMSSTKRTPWQSETARFWSKLSGMSAWNQAACSLVASRPLPLIENARLFMNLNVASFDSYLAVFEAKFYYAFWRPITAIRNGDIDGNEATERDASWLPLISTPMFPEYPCAHCIIAGAASVVLKNAFGSGTVPEFVLETPEMPRVTRKYLSIQQLEDEVDMARIWGGLHFRNSAEVAEDMGKRIGDFVLTSYLR
jgi:hypothetical protein